MSRTMYDIGFHVFDSYEGYLHQFNLLKKQGIDIRESINKKITLHGNISGNFLQLILTSTISKDYHNLDKRVAWLLSQGADPNYNGSVEFAPLTLATKNIRTDSMCSKVIAILLNYGATLKNNDRSLFYAAKKDFPLTEKVLINNGASLSAKDIRVGLCHKVGKSFIFISEPYHSLPDIFLHKSNFSSGNFPPKLLTPIVYEVRINRKKNKDEAYNAKTINDFLLTLSETEAIFFLKKQYEALHYNDYFIEKVEKYLPDKYKNYFRKHNQK